MIRRRAVGWALCALVASTGLAMGFDVIKNVNSGKPLEEKAVLFEKGKGADQVRFTDKPDCKFSINADGAIECRITGYGEIQPMIAWKPDVLGETFDARQYDYLVLTCRVEGNLEQTHANGKTTQNRPDNLWLSATLVNTQNQRVGLANLADVAEDEKTPSETVTLKIPIVLFTSSPNDPSKIKSIGFYMTATRPNMNRNLTLVIDRIVLANEGK